MQSSWWNGGARWLVVLSVTAGVFAGASGAPQKTDGRVYMVIDVAGGAAAVKWPVSYLAEAPNGGWGDEYKTGKIVLRHVQPGSFLRRRCTAEEAWRGETNGVPYEVRVDQPFYMGVFEISQRQYEHVTGMNPSRFSKADGWETRPVEMVSYDDIRGWGSGSAYPQSTDVDARSFLGILREKTGLATLDLPTEDMWEYCCRAGIQKKDAEVDAWVSPWPKCLEARAATVEIGSFKPNALGLYDLQGNVCEWCLDLVGELRPRPVPFLQLGSDRLVKGGCYDTLPALCNPSIAYVKCATFSDCVTGFRISCK